MRTKKQAVLGTALVILFFAIPALAVQPPSQPSSTTARVQPPSQPAPVTVTNTAANPVATFLTGTPTVNVGNTASVNIANTGPIPVSGAVSITNTVPISGNVAIAGTGSMRNVDEKGRNPYQFSVTFFPETNLFGSTLTCDDLVNCHADFPPVPAGRRLVITNISAKYALFPGGGGAEVGVTHDNLLSNALTLPAPSIASDTTIQRDVRLASGPVTYYVEDGSHPTIYVIGYPALGFTGTIAPQNIVITVTGYLVIL